MGRKYVINFASQAETAAFDALEITVPSDAVMVLHEVRITQSSDAGDAESEQLLFTLKRGIGATSGSGGASVTPQKLETGDAAAGITAEHTNTTQATAGGGSLTTLLTEAENVHMGWLHAPPPNRCFVFSPSEIAVVSVDAPADSLTFSGYAIVEEIGG